MASADRDKWFRSPAWDAQIAAAFEQRLRRARRHNRAQYIRIQATHLLSSPDPQARQAGRGLLRRLVTSFPDDFNAKMAMEQLGGSLTEDGRLAEAERALRETLRMCAQSPAGRSGTSGVAELRLAEVILAGGDAGRAGEAAGLLEAARPQVGEQRLFRNVVFRFLLASARAARLRSDPAAPELACAALAVAAETAPVLPRHPDAGRPEATALRSRSWSSSPGHLPAKGRPEPSPAAADMEGGPELPDPREPAAVQRIPDGRADNGGTARFLSILLRHSA